MGSASRAGGCEDLDRQLQQAAAHIGPTMTAEDGETPPPDAGDGDDADSTPSSERQAAGSGGETPPPDEPARRDNPTQEELDELRAELESFREDVEDRTLHRDEIKDDLRRYVRRELRRGHARGWGPYLVLLYGTAMTLGAFYYLQDQGLWAVLAMVVIWLSTLGLYVAMIVAGLGIGAAGIPRRLLDRLRG
ncbi:hypothetical protein [Halomicrobium katesii]|uniref:hypothetical protein n=1 Tax=Halomicrobium katesii TaxID=437163 RepID=UPI000380F063|nr:hypothetical protein [Halomicrobium katesii]